jgi:hypothetical protein
MVGNPTVCLGREKWTDISEGWRLLMGKNKVQNRKID